MDIHTATEEAYKKGYSDGYKDGWKDGKREAAIEQIICGNNYEDDECMENE